MKAVLRRVSSLTPGEREGMFELFGRCFDGTCRQRFEADLEDKNRALLLADDGGALRGFSTLAFYRTAAGGEPINVVCSGDTLVDPAAWGTSVLAPAWIAAVKRLDQERPAARLLWLLITSGYRTYRFLPVFWRQFYPRHDGPAGDTGKPFGTDEETFLRFFYNNSEVSGA